jgi:hypothetical protein
VRVEYLPVVGSTYNEVVSLIVHNIMNRGMIFFFFTELIVAQYGLHPLELGFLMISKFLHAVVSQGLVGHVAQPHQQVFGPDKGRGESTGHELGVMADK